MMDRTSSEPPRTSFFRATPYLLIIFLLVPIYFNSFHAEWQMDDRPNILDNPGLRINDLSPQSLWGTFFANQGKETKLFRPLPCLTFALNWYTGRTNPLGYHLVNLAFHIATAGVLYRLIIKLLSLSNYSRRRDPAWIQNVALLTTVLWAIHPIQTQAVTYIVQRMAVMAAFFYVLGILAFLEARTATEKSGNGSMVGPVYSVSSEAWVQGKHHTTPGIPLARGMDLFP